MSDENPTATWDAKNGTIVFVLGAGCSADCGAPTMQDFMRKAREYERALKPDDPRKEDYEALFTFREECLKVSYVFDRWWENIEHLFTQAHLRKLIGDEGADELCERVTRAIWDVYRRPSTQAPGARAYHQFKDYVRRIVGSYPTRARPVVVTTNYDIHLESTLAQVEGKPGCSPPRRWAGMIWYPRDLCAKSRPEDGFCGTEIAGRFLSQERLLEHRKIESAQGAPMDVWPLEIIKLHGSVNWFWTGSERSERCDEEIETRAGHGVVETGVPVFKCQGEQYVVRSGERPLIIPPLLGKADLPSLIAAQWRRAVQAMQWARLVVVIGYSFPETDTFMSRLLAEGIRSNKGLERFIIINPDADKPKWKARLERMFARSWWDFSVDRVSASFAYAAAGMSHQEWPAGLFKDNPPSYAQRLLRELVGLRSPAE